MDQRDLVERAQRGDHDAFAVLAGAAIARLDGAARLIVRDHDLARDAVQDALVRCWRDLPTLRDAGAFDGWLHRLLVNACLECCAAGGAARSRSSSRRSTNRRADFPASSIDRDLLDRALGALDPGLAGDRRPPLLPRVPLPEVARTLGIPLGTAKSRSTARSATLRAVGGRRQAAGGPVTDGGYA